MVQTLLHLILLYFILSACILYWQMEEEIKVLQEELTDIEYFIFKLEDLDKWFV